MAELNDEQQNTGQFSACIVTNIGKEMIAKSQNGQKLTFTRVALGDGLIETDDDILSFTKIKNERLSANIAKFTDKNNGQFQIQFRVSNQDVEVGFWEREIGIMAQLEGGEEQLYAYSSAGNKANFLYDKTTPVEERIVNIAFVIGNAQNVQVIVNSSIIYVTLEDMETHNNDTNAHSNLIKNIFGIENATEDDIKKKIGEYAQKVCLPLSGGTMKGLVNLFNGSTIPTPAENDNSIKIANTQWVREYIDNFIVGNVIYRPFLQEGYVKLNGAIVEREDYPRLVQYATDNSLFTENNTNTPWLFGNGDGEITFVLPDYRNLFIEGGDTPSLKVAGLPNITGKFIGFATNKVGCISTAEFYGYSSSAQNNNQMNYININAKDANSIYGSSTTVQPPAIVLIPQIKY